MQTSILLLIFIASMVNNIAAANDSSLSVEDHRAMKGLNAVLPCGTEDPIANGLAEDVAWYKNDRYLFRYPRLEPEIRHGTKHQELTSSCKSSLCPNNSGLYLERVNTEHAGLYRCRLYLGNISTGERYINLIVVDPIERPALFELRDGEEKAILSGYVGPYTVGSNVTLVCQVTALGVSKTHLFWERDGKKITGADPRSSGFIHIYLHLFNITRGEMDAQYRCVSRNSDVSELLKASATIKMFTPPLSVEIRMDGNYFIEVDNPRVVDCVVVGCMPPPVIRWHIGGRTMKPNSYKETHEGNYTISSLTLSASKAQDGELLVCSAHNAHIPNIQLMDQITLQVGFRPICNTRPVKIGAVSMELETVACIVDANPAPEKVLWTFADSLTMYTKMEKVPGATNRYMSNLTWLTRMDDIGPLLCQASNLYGNQTVPCTFDISSGGVPEVPNCDVTRSLPDSLRVRCIKGWDGGRPQIIHLDIVAQDGRHIKNFTDAEGMFFLPNVGYYGNMSALIYASNTRGRSSVKTTLLQSLIPKTEGKPRFYTFAWAPYVQALVALFVGVSSMGVFTVCVRIVLATRETDSEADVGPDGEYQRESDFLRQERLIDPAQLTVTVTQLEDSQDQYTPVPTPPPPPAYRVVFDDIPCRIHDATSYQTYYV